MSEEKTYRYWEMRPGLYYMHRHHLYRFDGEKFWRRPFDVWSEKYLPKWDEVTPDDLEALTFTPVTPGTKFPVLP